MFQPYHRLIALFLFLTLLGGIAAMGAISPKPQRQALIALYNSTNGDSWAL